MARFTLGGREFDVDLVVFDKDGTLIDLHRLWGGRAERCADWLEAELGAGPELTAALYQALGYDSADGRLLATGPLATIPRAQLVIVTATVLYQHGGTWQRAYDLATTAFADIMTAPPTATDLYPVGDVVALFRRLRDAGVRLAVATSDDREGTEVALELLNVSDMVTALVCGNDALPAKPAAAVLAHLAQSLGVPGERIMMVGDTECDMQTGRNGGAGCCLGVLSGAADVTELARCADVVVDSIQSLYRASGGE